MKLAKYTVPILLTISLLFLIAMLSYPFGYDQSVFAVGGDAVLKNGAFPGRDFLDTKPPFIFYIYSIALWMFGHHQWSIRAFDILFHLLSLSYFYFILKRIFTNQPTAILIIVLYVILYVSSGYWMTAQSESFALLPALVVLDCTLRYERRKNTSVQFLYVIVTSLSIVALILLKYTLGFVYLGLAGYLLFHSSKKLSARLQYIFSIGFFIMLFLCIYGFYLRSTGSLDFVILGIQWVSNYAAIVPLLGLQTIRNQYFLAFPQSVISAFTPLVCISFFIGLFFFYEDASLSLSTKLSPTTVKEFVSILLWQCVFGLLSIILERKNFAYQHTRILWACTPFVFLGLKLLWQKFIKRWNAADSIYFKFPLVSIFCVSLFFSPITKLLSQPLWWSWSSLTNNEPAKLDRLSHDQYYAGEIDSLSSKLEPIVKKDDNVLFWGNMVEFYFRLNKVPMTICLTNTPLVTPWTSEIWRTKFLQQLYNSRPQIIITERLDDHRRINGTSLDSFEAISQISEFKIYLDNNYHELMSSEHFIIFIRN